MHTFYYECAPLRVGYLLLRGATVLIILPCPKVTYGHWGDTWRLVISFYGIDQR